MFLFPIDEGFIKTHFDLLLRYVADRLLVDIRIESAYLDNNELLNEIKRLAPDIHDTLTKYFNIYRQYADVVKKEDLNLDEKQRLQELIMQRDQLRREIKSQVEKATAHR